MRALYVTSTGTFSGKTALCVGLGLRMQRDGFEVGYMKPVSTTARRLEGRIVDEDALFMAETLGLSEPLDVISPMTLVPHQVVRILSGEDSTDYVARLTAAFDKISQNKQVLILEGGASGDEVSEDDVFFQAEQSVLLAGDTGFGEDAGGFLEAGG